MHDIDMNNEDILAQHRELAEKNEKLLERHGIRAFNVMGAIGSGKTALIEALARRVAGNGVKAGAVAGDVAGNDDQQRFQAAGLPAISLNTGSDCHLDAHLLGHSLEELPLEEIELLFVENVGNLVCPADFPLGTERDLVVISVTEGEDMVRKHPKIFARSDIVVINKVDLADAIGVDPEKPRRDYEGINPNGKVFFTVAPEGEGVEELAEELGLRG